MRFEILKDEYWWGGTVIDAEKMPFDAGTRYFIDLARDTRTQAAPLFLSSKGRYIWSEDPYKIEFCDGWITTTSDSEVLLVQAGSTLRDAYLAAMRAHFPFAPGIHTPREFYQHPQFNTWMELIKNQNQEGILQYAEEVVQNGYTPGILIIDGGWQQRSGTWQFRHEAFSDPKAMVARLHELGFLVMIWVSPFICSEGDMYLELLSTRSSENIYGDQNYNHLLRNADGTPAIQGWWSGYGAIYNFLLPDDCAHMDGQLERLMNEYGIDGFKCDGGAYRPQSFLSGTDFYGGYACPDLNIAWIDYAAKHKYHEVKDSWKQGGKQVIQRLFDKRHSWDDNGINCLIPHGAFVGLIGSPFVCPDMIGGGEWTSFVYGTHEDELFIRMAQCSALFPMMQFSSLPWRHLGQEAQTVCREMALLHERMFPEIEKILTDSERTGEPMIRLMEYQYPGCGYETVRDQFLLGDAILVAPVIQKGQRTKLVRLPEGNWTEQNTGIRYEGPATVEVDAPLSVLPWFRKG